MTKWIVYGWESGEYKEFKSEKEAKEFVKEAKRFDRKNGLIGEKWEITKEEQICGIIKSSQNTANALRVVHM